MHASSGHDCARCVRGPEQVGEQAHAAQKSQRARRPEDAQRPQKGQRDEQDIEPVLPQVPQPARCKVRPNGQLHCEDAPNHPVERAGPCSTRADRSGPPVLDLSARAAHDPAAASTSSSGSSVTCSNRSSRSARRSCVVVTSPPRWPVPVSWRVRAPLTAGPSTRLRRARHTRPAARSSAAEPRDVRGQAGAAPVGPA